MKNKKLAESIIIAFLVSAVNVSVALLFTDTDSAWYSSLIKPSFQPPPTVFFIGWTVIYLLFSVSFGISLYFKAGKKEKVLYIVQAVLNILWCAMFFTLHLSLTALAVIILYFAVSLITVKAVFSVNKISSGLLLPQVCWLMFATALNYAIILLN